MTKCTLGSVPRPRPSVLLAARSYAVRCATRSVGLAAVLVMVGCGTDGSPKSQDFGNLLNSPGGLVVLEEEHPTGWGRPECFACHEIRNMHTVNRTGLPECGDEPVPPPEGCIDLDEIQAIIRDQGEASCIQCHGPNGVPTATIVPTANATATPTGTPTVTPADAQP